MKLEVILNGTAVNPYAPLGLTQNPFPQIPDYSVAQACIMLQKLGGEQIPDTDYIRKTLEGSFSEEFIELCCRNFVPDQLVKFEVGFPDN